MQWVTCVPAALYHAVQFFLPYMFFFFTAKHKPLQTLATNLIASIELQDS
jgi:hypothetical protein